MIRAIEMVILKCVLIIFLLFPILCFSQEVMVLNGKVLDQNSKLPLPLATVSVKNSSIGVLTNEAGDFEFYVPVNLKNDTLTIFYLGYKTFKKQVSRFSRNEFVLLTEEPTWLKEITVSGESARKLIEGALRAIPRIYPNQPYLMEGFHRSWERLESDRGSFPGTLIEAAVTIYDPGYLPKKNGKGTKEEIFINEVRRSALMNGWDYHRNILRDILSKNLVKQHRASPFVFLKSFFDFPNNLIYGWDGTTKIDGEDLAVIKVEISNKKKFPAYYRVYISEVDSAILRFDVMGNKTEIDYSIGPWHTDNLLEAYIFKRYRQKPYLSYCKIRYTIKKLDQNKKKVLRTEDYFRELLVNKIITTEAAERRKSLASKKSKDVSLALQTKTYNESFWKNYNVILDNPLDKEIEKFFEIQESKLRKREK